MRSIARMSILLSFALLAISPSQAAENMSFKGTLIEPPPCQINNGKDIDVPFDKIGVKSIDGINHRRPINYVLECTAGSEWSMVLTLRGPVAVYEQATLQTSIPNLGIKIYQNGLPFELATPIAINPQKPPKLEAVPVKKMGTELKEGVFDVTATLLAEYQ